MLSLERVDPEGIGSLSWWSEEQPSSGGMSMPMSMNEGRQMQYVGGGWLGQKKVKMYRKGQNELN